MIDLKPCPFCDCAAELEWIEDKHGCESSFSLGCSDSSCPGFHVYDCWPSKEDENAIRAWNRRTEAVEPKTGMELMMAESPPRIVVMLENLKADAVMSKFATARECQAYRAAVQDMLELIHYYTSPPASSHEDQT